MVGTALCRGILLLIILALSVIVVVPAYAGTPNIAITGSFYKYEYTLAPNTTIGGRDIYIAIINNADQFINVTLGYEAPQFIKITFSQQNITLEPGGHEIIYINISVLSDAVPGEYEVKVYANIVVRSVEGKVVLIPGVGQKTVIRIVGPVGRIIAETVDREGNHVSAELRLFRVSEKGKYTYTEGRNGYIDTHVPPGRYIVQAVLAGEVLAEEKVYVKGNETKRVVLSVSTIWFDYFDVLPYYRDNNIVFVEIISVLKNVYKPINNTNIVLVVQYNDVFLENVTIASIPTLFPGRAEYKYRYIPVGGWENGTYSFKLVLVSGSIKYAETSPKEINITIHGLRNVTETESKTVTVTISPPREGGSFNYMWLLIAIAVTVVVVVVLVYKYGRKM